MKHPRSLFTLTTFLLLCSWLTTTAQNDCDSLGYEIELFSPNIFESVEYGETVELEVATSFPLSEISTIEWFSEFGLFCDNCLANTLAPTDTTVVQVQITLDDGCVVSDEFTINVFLLKNVYVPNAFSPNGDGINEVFLVYGYTSVDYIKSLKVFSRKGHLLHEAYDFRPNDPIHGWNGRLRGENLNSEVYVWKTEIVYINGDEETLTGTFNLIR